MKNIWAHTLVKNEECFIWYCVMSVIEQVEKILIWDTGSTDNTLAVIKEIIKRYPKKVIYNQVGSISSEDFPKIRQKMLDETKSDWFLVVDGDEIWWDESIKKVTDFIQKEGDNFESIVVPNILPVGDIYHYLEKAAGEYKLAGKKGHYNLRGINRNIYGLKSDKPHGTWGWVDENMKMIQDRNHTKIKYLDTPYLHTTFLGRSKDRIKDQEVPKRKHKLKFELGTPFVYDYYYPEVFFRPKPHFIESLWQTRSFPYVFKAAYQTPLKRVKRRLIHGKVGY